jgi:NAD(P)-dependent dehydrogenase (short-subunit alcohol dehydrogenase family)
MELENQAAIIMGAGRGIGKAIAEKFYPEGPMPAVWDIEQGLTEGVAASLDPYG